MTDPAPIQASPFAGIRLSVRLAAVLAVFVALVMIGSSANAFMTSAPGPAVAPGTPSGGSSWLSPMVLQSGAQLQSDPTSVLAGAPLSDLQNASVIGPAPPNEDMYFTVGFPLQNEGELAAIINEQGEPGSPLYHDWLDNAQEATMFGPPAAEVQDTVNYFTSLGFSVATDGPISISFQAPVHLIESAFHTTLSEVRYGNATSTNTTIANTAPLQVPEPIAGGIDAIDGLSGPGGNYQVYHSQNPQFAAAVDQVSAAEAAQSAPAGIAPIVYNATMEELYNYTDQAYAWFGYNYQFGHQALTARTQTISAATLNQLFQADPLLSKGYNGNSTGHPITIVIVMEGGINPGDIQSYSQLVWNNPYQLYDRISPDPVDGAFTWNGTLYYTDGGSGEMALDIEYSGTMAPGAHIVPVYSQAFYGNMLDDQYATIDKMVPTPNIISNSWGGPEDEAGTLDTPGIGSDLVMHNYFMLLDAKGASILASSGDGGGFDVTTGILSGSFPASDPYVLSVNGLRTNAQNSYGQIFPTTNLTYGNLQTFIPLLDEFQNGLGVNVDFKVTKADGLHNQSYWYDPFSNLTLYDEPPDGSGGFGLSYWSTQPWYEHAIGVPDVGRSLGSGVAAEADFNMSIFFDGVPNFLYGGTSFACPTTAGMIADIEDYLNASGVSGGNYLGNLNMPVFELGNAWLNGNLALPPFYNVDNGTSYWGNVGADHQYAWPPGQNFPMDGTSSTYGDTTTGWSFPTGWGSINAYNFAVDLKQLMTEEGFMTVNSTSGAFEASLWANMTLNETYTINVGATSTIAGLNPVVTIEYFPDSGTKQTWNVSGASLTSTGSPVNGLRFTLNTGAAPFSPAYSPGLLIFVLSDKDSANVGFSYDFVGPYIPPGALNVQVLNPGPTNSIVGGCATANLDSPLGAFVPNLVQSGFSCSDYSRYSGQLSDAGVLYENTFAVRVTNSLGQPIYNAEVTAEVPQLKDLAWVGSTAERESSWKGIGLANGAAETNNIVSVTYTNITGVALVQTWNMAYSAPYFVNATYGPESGGTSYEVTTTPNIDPIGLDNGKYAEFNSVDLELYVYQKGYSNATENSFVPNFTNTSSLYDTIYAWQGQQLSLHVTNSNGTPLAEQQVWLGTFDTGREYKFQRYEPTGGLLGMTNSSDTSGFTDGDGDITLDVPDNASATNYYDGLAQAPIGIAGVAVNLPGMSNNSFDYNEQCAPLNRSNPNLFITCEFNNSYTRDYSAEPMWILPDPVNVTTETPSRVIRDFFPSGSPVSFLVNVSLPTENPLGWYYYIPYGYDGNPYQWSSGLEHITGMTAYVDGHFAANITPEEPPEIQLYAAFVNLTGNYSAGIHNLTVVVTTSMDQVFTYTHRFVVGSIVDENLSDVDLYTTVPYNLTWSLNLPPNEVSNLTFNSSLQITYLGSTCPDIGCPVVNQSVRVNPGKVNYEQQINATLLASRGFYADAGEFPTASDYEITIWFNANHSGSLRQGVSTKFIFDPLSAEILGPLSHALVPIGNVTIAYQYQGDYITSASLDVWQNQSAGASSLVFSELAFQPGIGGALRGGSTTWTPAAAGNYWVEILVGSPEGNYTAGESVNVSNLNPTATVTKTDTASGLFGLATSSVGTMLVLISAIVGILLGLWISPALRPSTPSTGGAGGAPAAPKAWEEGKGGDGKPAAAAKNECSICHERFETAMGLTQHQRVVHGVEE